MSSPAWANFPSVGSPTVDRFNRLDADMGAYVETALTSGTFAVASKAGGGRRISGAATTDDSGGQIQHSPADILLSTTTIVEWIGEIFVNETTSTDVAEQSDLIAGLAVIDTSLIASAATDGIYFRKDDGDENLDAVVRVGSAEVAVNTAILTLAENTTYELAIRVTYGSGLYTATFFVDGVTKASLNFATAPSTLLTESVAFISGNNLGTMFCDVSVLGARQRTA